MELPGELLVLGGAKAELTPNRKPGPGQDKPGLGQDKSPQKQSPKIVKPEPEVSGQDEAAAGSSKDEIQIVGIKKRSPSTDSFGRVKRSRSKSEEKSKNTKKARSRSKSRDRKRSRSRNRNSRRKSRSKSRDRKRDGNNRRRSRSRDRDRARERRRSRSRGRRLGHQGDLHGDLKWQTQPSPWLAGGPQSSQPRSQHQDSEDRGSMGSMAAASMGGPPMGGSLSQPQPQLPPGLLLPNLAGMSEKDFAALMTANPNIGATLMNAGIMGPMGGVSKYFLF